MSSISTGKKHIVLTIFTIVLIILVLAIGGLLAIKIMNGQTLISQKDNNTTSGNHNEEVEPKEITAKAISQSNNKSKYYGAIVSGYECTNSEIVKEWKLLYSDNKHIYLIAGNYIPKEAFPKLKDGSNVGTNISGLNSATISDVINDYTGSADITDENIKALNSDYFNYLSKNKDSSTTDSMKKVAYLLDTKIWSDFAGQYAEYAIGGPSIEILLNSYNKKYQTNYKFKTIDMKGYLLSDTNGESWGAIEFENSSDPLYFIKDVVDASGFYVASPMSDNTSGTAIFTCNQSGFLNYGSSGSGFRPVVCLKSDTVLEKQDDDSFKILAD